MRTIPGGARHHRNDPGLPLLPITQLFVTTRDSRVPREAQNCCFRRRVSTVFGTWLLTLFFLRESERDELNVQERNNLRFQNTLETRKAFNTTHGLWCQLNALTRCLVRLSSLTPHFLLSGLHQRPWPRESAKSPCSSPLGTQPRPVGFSGQGVVSSSS